MEDLKEWTESYKLQIAPNLIVKKGWCPAISPTGVPKNMPMANIFSQVFLIDPGRNSATVIYFWKHKSKPTWKYVGQAVNFIRRTGQHVRRAFSQAVDERQKEKSLGRALRRSNVDDWELEVLEVVDNAAELDWREVHHILEKNTLYPSGLNMRLM